MNLDEQQLIYNGGMLEDDNKTVDKYQIAPQSTIQVVTRLKLILIT